MSTQQYSIFTEEIKTYNYLGLSLKKPINKNFDLLKVTILILKRYIDIKIQPI